MSDKSSKLENVRVVTFKEDWLSKAGEVIFKKGRTIAMHNRTITKLIARGAKADVKLFDKDKAVKRKKEELAILTERNEKLMYK